ncbi:hypothetical protein BKA62DRAFT_284526 [Auriculariales sp. MPI-PUGE-AT-0066]|nr:hypothetical protein BKA62DRAFT_284526 [Auriculariales sp. MPI-PUGE-AT-0066]
MRFFSLLFVAASALAAAASKIQPSVADLQAATAQPVTSRRSVHHERVTNAMRMRRGLPPLPPRHIPHAGTPTVNQNNILLTECLLFCCSCCPRLPIAIAVVDSRRTSGASDRVRFIKITSKTDGSVLGYLSKEFAVYGEYAVAADINGAMSIGIDRLKSGLNKAVDLQSLNGAESPYNYIGAITGWSFDSDDLVPGEASFKYIGGMSRTPAWSSPVQSNPNAFSVETGIQKASESSIWQINTVTSEITASWINSDGRPALSSELMFYPSDNVLVLVGDSARFEAEYGVEETPSVPIKLSLVVL